MSEDNEQEWAVNEAALYFDNGNLVVVFGYGRSVSMELSSDNEREVVKTMLGDINLWTMFINSLSSALTTHK